MTGERAPDRVAGELTGYFLTGDADQGLSSSWGPLASIALGGFGGSPDPERRADDRSFGLGPARRSRVTQAREVRAALLRLSSEHVAALWAAFGPTPWGKIIDHAFGRGMALKVQKRLGDLAAVALLTREVTEGFKTAPQPASGRRAWQGPGGYLVALCLDASESGKAKTAKIKSEAQAVLDKAKGHYIAARTSESRVRVKRQRATTGDRRRAVESEAG